VPGPGQSSIGQCVNGQCEIVCEPGYYNCDGLRCSDLLSDPLHCGACGNACGPGEGCVNGQCVGGPGGGCPAGLTDCGGVCVDLSSDANNCGACGLPCAFQGGWGLCCNGMCVDQMTDVNHCGACFQSCPPGRACVNSVCEGDVPPAGDEPKPEGPPEGQPAGRDEAWQRWQEGSGLRGAHLLQRLGGGDAGEPIPGSEHVGPGYSLDDLRRLADFGANYVELTHPVPVAEGAPMEPDEGLAENLDRLVNMAAEVGLSVVIGFFGGPGRPEHTLSQHIQCRAGGCFAPSGDAGEDVASFWFDPEARSAWAEAWRRTAERYREHPAVIGYNIMVSPDPPEMPMWLELYPSLVQAIRDVDAETPVLVTLTGSPRGFGVGQVEALEEWRPEPIERTVYRAVLFGPERFMVQSPDEPDRLIYPGEFDPDRDGATGVPMELPVFDRGWIADVLAGPVAEMRGRVEGPVAVEAYGVPRWQPGALVFLEDLTFLFEELGLNSALWLHYPMDWPPEADAFDLERGPDPANHENVPNEVLGVVQEYWRRSPSMNEVE
jgi:hypothetical protein